MKRAIITPAVLPAAALAELKDWLGISTMQDDTQLGILLRSAVELCEDFTGIMPLQQLAEEVLPITGQWQRLSARPVLAITLLEGVPAEGARYALAPGDYAIDLDAEGAGLLRVAAPGAAGRVAVRFSAGLSASWPGLPEGLRRGILRLAAHLYRSREDSTGAAALPPAAVAALWRPWRRLRLA